MDAETDLDVAGLLRSVRLARRISQRELAELAGIPAQTVARTEAGRTVPNLRTLVRLLAVAGYELSIHDRHGRPLRRQGDVHRDRAGRQFPAHLFSARTRGYFESGSGEDSLPWWGWHNIAWPFGVGWVPDYTFTRRRVLPRYEWVEVGHREQGRVWDDAT